MGNGHLDEFEVFTVAFEGDDFPEVEQIIEWIDEIHSQENRPIGDRLDQAFDRMMIDVSLKHNMNYTVVNDSNVVFYPKHLSETDVISQITQEIG